MQERVTGTATLSHLVQSLHQHGETWHARPDAESIPQFVLDDGTGDIEIHFVSLDNRVEARLAHRGVEKASREFPFGLEPSRTAQHFEVWLTEELARLQTYEANSRPGQGRTRFMVTLDSNQLDRLRELADQQGVPITELVRAAVDQYLSET